MRYRKLWESEEYQCGIYDRCDAAIYIRKDGLRMRIEWDGIKWTGNSGTLHRYTKYVAGRNWIKTQVRDLRQRQIQALKFGMGKNHIWCLTLDNLPDNNRR